MYAVLPALNVTSQPPRADNEVQRLSLTDRFSIPQAFDRNKLFKPTARYKPPNFKLALMGERPPAPRNRLHAPQPDVLISPPSARLDRQNYLTWLRYSAPVIPRVPALSLTRWPYSHLKAIHSDPNFVATLSRTFLSHTSVAQRTSP